LIYIFTNVNLYFIHTADHFIRQSNAREAFMRFNQEVKKWATDLHIFLHKAEHFLPHCNTSEEFTAKVFDSFEEKPQFLSNDEVEEMLLELWSAYKDGRLTHID
tara:strand:- start:166 stop:477 length:312 start_codon:yes stop_codon:yes gene_type:complete